MNSETLNIIIDDRCEKIKSILQSKAKEYSSDNDRLYNFRRAAEISRTSNVKALFGMMLKHWVSVIDIIEMDYSDRVRLKEEYIDEKIGDTINYLILLEAMVKEEIRGK
jgi:hypothetical protein